MQSYWHCTHWKDSIISQDQSNIWSQWFVVHVWKNTHSIQIWQSSPCIQTETSWCALEVGKELAFHGLDTYKNLEGTLLIPLRHWITRHDRMCMCIYTQFLMQFGGKCCTPIDSSCFYREWNWWGHFCEPNWKYNIKNISENEGSS